MVTVTALRRNELIEGLQFASLILKYLNLELERILGRRTDDKTCEAVIPIELEIVK